MGRLYEKLLTKELTTFLETNCTMNRRQFGLRMGKSSADLMLILTTKWQEALDHKEDKIAVAFDIAGDFDRVWHK